MPRSPARRRPVPRIRSVFHGFGMGKKVRDAVSGVVIAKRFTVEQRGGQVDARYSEGSRDRPDKF